METTQTDWVAYFKQLVESVLRNDEVAKAAIDAVVGACHAGVSEADAPATALSRIITSNNETKIEALKLLHEFITVNG